MYKPDQLDVVQKFYDTNPEIEWNRLADKTIEFEINKRFIARHVKPGSRVLDIGGGPGRYSLWLASIGCDATLADLSQGNVDYALMKSGELGLPIAAVQANALDLSRFADASFDHVLLMGPMYHLTEQHSQRLAVSEARRVLKPGGTLSVSFISSFAGMIYGMRDEPEIVLSAEACEREYRENAMRDEPFAGMGFTHAYMIRQQDVVPFMESFALKTLHFLSSEGVSAPFHRYLMAASEPAQAAWMELSVALCETEKYLSFAEHFLYIGRKPA